MKILPVLSPFTFVFISALLLGLVAVPLIRKLAPGQRVRDDGPSTHFSKSGTPTFGGLIFIIPIFLSGLCALLFKIPGASHYAAMTIYMFFSGAVGFIDDHIKVRVNKKGLDAGSKSLLLLIGIVVFTLYYLFFSGEKPFFLVPFTGLSTGGTVVVPEGFWKIVYGAVIAAVLYFTGNAVNITDGVDGLASSVTFVAAVFLGSAGIALDSEMSNVSSLFAFSIAGGCAAFFIFNRYPARIFMGDTGSQALGAGIAAAAVLMGAFWILVPVGIVYVIESLSVIIQVLYFKKTRKRVFRMAPLHHHFELGGWSEWKITGISALIASAGGILGILMIL